MSILRRFLRREQVDSWIDRWRFRLDRFPSMDYQPMPWLGVEQAGRSRGVLTRWERIESLVAELDVRTALDVGCNVGYFSIQLGLKGVTVLAIESEPKFFRMAQHGIRTLKLDNVGLLSWNLVPGNLRMLPPTDCVLLLSVWHHFVRIHGPDAASGMLRELWASTQSVLFFDTGEKEMPDEYRLPDMGPDPAGFLRGFLQAHCPSGEIRHLGRHDAFAPEGRRVERNLFAVVRAGRRDRAATTAESATDGLR